MVRLPALLLLWALAACSAPAPAPPSPPGTTPPPAVVVDRSCRSDAECTVKDVGNCCGAYPACVNAASPADPAAVRAHCLAQGMMDVCGFTQIQGCRCVQGQCRATPALADARHRPLTPNLETAP